jgi:hypothetical protein
VTPPRPVRPSRACAVDPPPRPRRGRPPALRAALGALAALVLVALPVPAAEESAPAAGEPEPCAEITQLLGFGLGFDAPIDGGGKFIPIVAAYAYGDGLLGPSSRLRGFFETTTLTLTAELPVAGPFFAGGQGGATALCAQGSTYRYDDGDRVERLEVEAHSGGGGPVVGVEMAPRTELRAFLDARRLFFRRPSGGRPDLVLPREHVLWKAGLRASTDRMRWFQSWQVAEGFDAWACAEYFGRDAWAPWGLPGEPQTHAGRDRQGARVSGCARAALRFFREQDLRVTAEAGCAWDADVLTAFRAGSLVGEIALPGTYYAEVPCDRHLLLGARYGRNLWEGARGWVSWKGGCLREVGGPVRGVLGFSAGVTVKLMFGMPLTVEYAFSPTAERERGAGGHEIYVLAAAAFF